jgi:hypothetical protein
MILRFKFGAWRVAACYIIQEKKKG